MKRSRDAVDGDGGAEEGGGDPLIMNKRGASTTEVAAAAGTTIAPLHSSSSSYSHDRGSHSSGRGAGDNIASVSGSASGSASAAMDWAARRKLRRQLHKNLQMVKGLIARLEARERVLSFKDFGQGKGSGSGADSSAQPSSSGQEAGGEALTRDAGMESVGKRRGDAVDAFMKERSAVGARMALAETGSDSRGRVKTREGNQSVEIRGLSQTKLPKNLDFHMKAAETEALLHTGNNSRELHRVVEGGLIFDSDIRAECLNILEDLLKNRNAWAFEKPVLVIWPHLFDYTNRIKSPMDLGTVKRKLLNGEYSDPREFASDVRLTFENAFAYNEKGSVFFNAAKHIHLRFNSKFRHLEMRLARMPDQNKVRHLDPVLETKTVARTTGSGLLVESGVTTQTNFRGHSERKLPSDQSRERPSEQWLEPVPPQNKKPKSKQRLDKPPNSRLGRSTSAFAYGGVRPLTAKEREKLPLLIESLPADRVKKVIDILKQKNPTCLESSSGEVELDLAKFDEGTMFELYRLAMNWQKSKKKILGRSQHSEESKEPAQDNGPIHNNTMPQNNATISRSGVDNSMSPLRPSPSKARDSGSGGGPPYSGKPKDIGLPRQQASGSGSEFSSSSDSSSGSSSSSGSGSDSESDADSQQSSKRA